MMLIPLKSSKAWLDQPTTRTLSARWKPSSGLGSDVHEYLGGWSYWARPWHGLVGWDCEPLLVSGRCCSPVDFEQLLTVRRWCDRAKGVAGMITAQILPFGDPAVMGTWAACEKAVYDGLSS